MTSSCLLCLFVSQLINHSHNDELLLLSKYSTIPSHLVSILCSFRVIFRVEYSTFPSLKCYFLARKSMAVSENCEVHSIYFRVFLFSLRYSCFCPPSKLEKSRELYIDFFPWDIGISLWENNFIS